MFVMNYNGPNCNSNVTTPVVSVRSYRTLQGRPARPDTVLRKVACWGTFPSLQSSVFYH